MIQTILILVLAISGFFIAKYIRKHKTKNTPLICPARFDCHTVVHSDYSKFFGIPVEILGMTYYAFIALFYFFLIFSDVITFELPETIVFLVLPVGVLFWALSLIAFLFSTYLIAVQIFILKKGCSWCIVSALICLTIFILVFYY